MPISGRKLPEDPQVVLDLRYTERKSYQEIADLYGTTREAVRQCIAKYKLPVQPTRIALLKYYQYGTCPCGKPLDKRANETIRFARRCPACRADLLRESYLPRVSVKCPMCGEVRVRTLSNFLIMKTHQEVAGMYLALCGACWRKDVGHKILPRERKYSYFYPPRMVLTCRECGHSREVTGYQVYTSGTYLLTRGVHTDFCRACWYKPGVRKAWFTYKKMHPGDANPNSRYRHPEVEILPSAPECT